MSKHEKLLNRFLSKPKDFTFNELIKVLKYFNYKLISNKKTGGSARIFKSPKNKQISIHEPHGSEPIPQFQIQRIIKKLKELGELKDDNTENEL